MIEHQERRKVRMWMKLALNGMFITTFLLAACGVDEDNGNISSPEVTIEDVTEFLAGVCELAAQCPGISPTPAEIAACPLEIQSELHDDQLNELERFTTYTKSQQDCILECIGGAICDRFGVALSAISDSDVLEPFRACEQQCL
jgi:hypothetical protein